MKKIPNIITCLNLFSGCLSCIMTLEYENYIGAFVFILLAAIFDFFDGFAARLLKAFSPIGADLDSLADVVSFGVAPGFIVFSFLSGFPSVGILEYSAFLIPIFSALRLAKFNIDTRQTTSFLGLPVPANALFWASLVPALSPYTEGKEMFFSGIMLALILVFSSLMVSELPMFSLKFKHYGWKENQWPYALILTTIILTVLFQFLGVSLSIVCYIVFSLINFALSRSGAEKSS
ncbi:CDP-diacylglycerol--serine O-phosphatidyltransferase [Bacteroidia bacterium]|nr:CDP-diacylglycerol--serine O-phosphatidyltransferase [Bacteroidia bacterium]